MSDRGSEQGSDHTDWAFVDDGASHEAGSASPGRSVSPGRPCRAVEGFADRARFKISAGWTSCVLQGLGQT